MIILNLITKYSFGRMIVNEMKYNKDLIVFPDEIKTNWWRKEGHKLCLEDLSILKEKQPKILILGTGSLGLMKVPDEVIEKLKEMGIEVYAFKTQEAVEKYNEIAQQGKKVAGAFHLTC
ncbi:MAG: Mth938-like domain-containing protein [Candidatus Heimdallarchaeaceae archaeon]